MVTFRHEPQLVQTLTEIKALNNTTTPNQANDLIIWGDRNRMFRWVPTSTATADDEFVIQQTDVVGAGRWVAITARQVYQGTVTVSATSNGQTAVDTGTVTGVEQGDAVAIRYDAADLPAGMFVESACISANDTIRLAIANESGADVASFTIDVTVIAF